jgi:hypothetical protein
MSVPFSSVEEIHLFPFWLLLMVPGLENEYTAIYCGGYKRPRRMAALQRSNVIVTCVDHSPRPFSYCLRCQEASASRIHRPQ